MQNVKSAADERKVEQHIRDFLRGKNSTIIKGLQLTLERCFSHNKSSQLSQSTSSLEKILKSFVFTHIVENSCDPSGVFSDTF